MASSSFKAPKGTRDLSGFESQQFTRLESVARQIFDSYHFAEVRTPIFESTDLFARTLGENSDVVQKEMFTFSDRGERNFALRPEGTAGVVRFFLEKKLYNQGGIHRLFYMGPMFRAERPQAGRYRQFWQIGIEYFGNPSPSADADSVIIGGKILRQFGLEDFTIQFNSLGCGKCRPPYRKALLNYLQKIKDKLTKESQDRMTKNPLRVLDSKEDGPKVKDAPVMVDFLCEGCSTHHTQFKDLVQTSGFKLEENHRLVRGLDYYTRTVFEYVSPHLGAQNALAAGGRYDDLVAHLGGPSTPGVGFAMGVDRIVAALEKSAKDIKNYSNSSIFAVIAPLEAKALPVAFGLANELRERGIKVPPVVVKKKVGNILSGAVEIGANWAILIGGGRVESPPGHG